MTKRLAAAEERADALRKELEAVERAFARLPDPPEPLTAGELAAGALPDRSRPRAAGVPAPPADSAPGTIAAARADLAAGRRSAVDLVEEALERARAGRHLGAFLKLREEEALAEARRLTGSPGASGQGGGGRPLLGIPLSVKDIVDVAGMTTTSGSKFPHEAARSAPAWGRLADAGAILLGKNNLQEFAFGVSGDNPTFGRTRNPHDPARIPGGSSSGSAVAVATGMGYGSVGTDTGGSIRIPASLNGVFGLKPSYGAVSRAGVTPLSWSLDHVGPIARSAGDIALLFEVLSGRSPGPASPRAAGSEPLAGVRVGVPLDFFYTDLVRDARGAADGIVAALVGLGAERVEVRIPEVELSGVCRNVLAFGEAAVVHRERLAARPDDISEDVRRLLDVGGVLSAADLITALRAGASSPARSRGSSRTWTCWWSRPPRRAPRRRGSRSRPRRTSVPGSSAWSAPSTSPDSRPSRRRRASMRRACRSGRSSSAVRERISPSSGWPPGSKRVGPSRCGSHGWERRGDC